MKLPASILATLALCAAGTALAAGSREEANEARLAELLEGREAGEPVTCVPAFRTDRLRIIDNVALVYDAGDTLYVARPRNPEGLSRDDVVVINRFGSQLCTTDIIRTVDRSAGFMTGVVMLENFVPYKKVK